ncbi:MAG: hypothetical protein F6K55_04195 [Moorea sp. SIO4A3]|nr:hypothetical protein [Moorena sp. SIO4A3]
MSEISEIEQPITVKELVLGDWNDALIEDDKVRKQLGKPGLLEVFKTSPATGCITIMDMARISSGFNPFKPLYSDNYKAFLNYIDTIKESGVFDVNPIIREKFVNHKNDSWFRVINAILAYYKDVTTVYELEKIKVMLNRLVNNAKSRFYEWQRNNLFAQQIVEVDQNKIIVEIYNSKVNLRESTNINFSGDKIRREAFFSIEKISCVFYFNRWADHAETVPNTHIKLVRDWLNENSTKSRVSGRKTK